MLGAYLIRGASSALEASEDPRLPRLRAAWRLWSYTRTEGGVLCVQAGAPVPQTVDGYGPARPCENGLDWLPPKTLPALYDLAREDPPGESTEVVLRRIGPVTIPLGLGPIYGAGRKRGLPSSEYGRHAADLHRRAVDKAHAWCAADELDTERLLFLALRQGYHLTWEIFGELAPYDLDEVSEICVPTDNTGERPLAIHHLTSAANSAGASFGLGTTPAATAVR